MTLRAILLSIFIAVCNIKAWSIQASATHTVFYKKNTKDSNRYDANVLLNWRIKNSSLHFTKDEKGLFAAKLACVMRWSNDTGVYSEQIFNINLPAQKTKEDALNQFIGDQYSYKLPTGHYQIEMAIFEPEFKQEVFLYNDTLTIRKIPGDQPFLSGIQLLDTFFSSNMKSEYSRNNYFNLALSSNYLNEKKNNLFVNYELYEANKTQNGPLSFNCFISWKPYGSPVPGMERKSTISSSDAQAFYTAFPLEDVQSGNYYVNIVLKDKYEMVLDQKSVFIQRYNTRPKPEKTAVAAPVPVKDTLQQKEDTAEVSHILDLTATFVGKYNAAQVREILKMMLLVCEPSEAISINGFLKKPDEVYSKYFIYNFWEKRDKANPDAAWKAFTERIKEVNRLFGGTSKGGYETDRGKIYMTYGKPNDRIIVNNEPGSLPYEIWQYYSTEKQGLEGVFLFYKPAQNMGGYEVLHSTLVGEKRNNNWRALLYNNTSTGAAGTNENSQAEQYIRNR